MLNVVKSVHVLLMKILLMPLREKARMRVYNTLALHGD
jgi:hypothetical protein